MTSQHEPTFEGWLADSPDSVKGQMRWGYYQPKPFEETDIDIKVTHCGICGSDIHTLRSGWRPANYPICVGHEIIGHAIRVGSAVKSSIRVGDRVGVGAQSSSCLGRDCPDCSVGKENYCAKGSVGTYDSKYPDGSKSFGGYANFARVPGHFVFKIPEGIASADAAPMLCGGVTAYTPLVENGVRPETKVGIAGLGGLGHFGLLWAKALGCETIVAISRSRSKETDARKLGATCLVATGEEKWFKKHARSLDLIVSTVGDNDLPLSGYLGLLKTGGTLVQVGVPEGKITLNLAALIGKGTKIAGSSIGSPQQIEEMLQLAARKNVKPWIQEIPMKDANRAIVEFEEGKPRYRFVLVNEEKQKL
jgi:alcohol dehydrogenase (NADP+)